MVRLSIIGTALAAAVCVAGGASAEVTRHACVPKTAEIRFKAADGTRLAGYRLGRGKTAVVLAHQVRGDACQWASYARRLAGRGYLVIALCSLSVPRWVARPCSPPACIPDRSSAA
jgi:hypothetical protein